MGTNEVINLATSKGVYLYLDNEKLKFKSKKGALSDDLLQLIKQHKETIISSLREQDNAVDESRFTTTPLQANSDRSNRLSSAQQRIWYIDHLNGQSPEYNITAGFWVQGNLDSEVVEKAFAYIINRHEVLRTVYKDESGIVIQHILENVTFNLKREDFSHLFEDAQKKAVASSMDFHNSQPFDLSKDLMLRASLIRLGHSKSALLLSLHHIAADGWSMELLFNEFAECYRAFSLGEEVLLPSLDIQYADFADWQYNLLESNKFAAQLEFWQQNLEDLPILHRLPLKGYRPDTKGIAGDVIQQSFDTELTQGILIAARKHKMTPFMFIHAALSLVISKFSNSTDIAMGTSVANRTDKKLENSIGLFINSLVLRTKIQQEVLGEYLSYVRKVNLEAQRNQDISFDQLVGMLKLSGSKSYNPLFQIHIGMADNFGVFNSADKNQQFLQLAGDIELSPIEETDTQTKFDLEIDIEINEQSAAISWTFDVELFSKVFIESLGASLSRVLAEMVSHDDISQLKISQLPFLSSLDFTDLTKNNNDIVPEKNNSLIHHLFEAVVSLHTDKSAVVFGETSLTYRELNERGNQLARHLLDSKAIQENSRVGICAESSLDVAIAIFAILKAGAAYVPLDPNYPAERLSYIMEDAKLDLILTQSNSKHVLQSYKGQVISLDGLSDKSQNQHSCAGYSVANLAPQEVANRSPGLAYVIYTSGSTGKPKGVMIGHQALVNYQLHISKEYRFSDTDRVLQFSSLSFDIFVEEFFGALCSGATLVIKDKECVQGLAAFSEFCNRHKITVASLPTAFWSSMVSYPKHAEIMSLRMVIVGGEALSVQAARNHMEKFGDYTQLVNTYGPTEATITATSYPVSARSLDLDVIPIGKANVNYALYIINHDLTLTPKDCVGELAISGPGLSRGYLNKDRQTNASFVDNPFYQENMPDSYRKLYKTGDQVRRLSDGNLQFMGRLDDQVKIRGFRVELIEIEETLAQNVLVDSAIVLTKEIDGSLNLVAYVKKQGAKEFDTDKDFSRALKSALSEQLPDYMIPAQIIIVEDWPLTINGKVDKNALAKLTGNESESPFELMEPTTELETQLVDIWASVLRIRPETIDINDSFFQLGGSSILVIKVMYEVKEKLQKSILASEFVRNPTIKGLADSLQKENLANKSILVPVCNIARDKPPLFLVPGAGMSSISFYEFGVALAEQYELLVFEDPALNGEEGFDSFESMIAVFTKSILASCPDEEITLSGFSVGANIAFEMALALEAEGRRVRVVIIDSMLMGYQDEPCSDDELIEYFEDEGITDSDYTHTVINAFNRQSEFASDYEPSGVLSGELLLIFARESDLISKREVIRQQIQAYCEEEVKMELINGGHFDLFSGREAIDLARVICSECVVHRKTTPQEITDLDSLIVAMKSRCKNYVSDIDAPCRHLVNLEGRDFLLLTEHKNNVEVIRVENRANEEFASILSTSLDCLIACNQHDNATDAIARALLADDIHIEFGVDAAKHTLNLYSKVLFEVEDDDVFLQLDQISSNTEPVICDSDGIVAVGDQYKQISGEKIVRYMPTLYNMIRGAIEMLQEEQSSLNFVDLGCGKGRVLFTAMQYPFAKVMGLELFEELAVSAKENLAKLPAEHVKARSHEVVVTDATLYQFAAANTAVYCFDSFEMETKKKILDNLYHDVVSKGYRLYFLNVTGSTELLENTSWLKKQQTKVFVGGVWTVTCWCSV